jgi:large subunit ribosomal protein LP2
MVLIDGGFWVLLNWFSFASAVGAEADADRISLLLKELEGKDILEVIAAGKEKFASVPSGGGGGVVVSSGGGAAAPAAAEEKKEEEKKEEPKEESDDVSFGEIFLNYEANCMMACRSNQLLCCHHGILSRGWHS